MTSIYIIEFQSGGEIHMNKIKGLKITARTWGMTNTWQGHAFVDPDGQACPVHIKPAGHGKFSFGQNRIYTDDYPEGVYLVEVRTEEINITFYPPEGGKEKLRSVLAPEPVQKFAIAFNKEANCYHCKCLESHLQAASEAARKEETPLMSA